ncbi:branched-chain amino acid ABC transporter permease [Brucella pseudogrignonensis]|uniref:branched-chain amino acid ABC transporter permease n=1 Tax=Brucella pseudogrignonensis TaxID=419475 RepID=UPI00124CC329|nr:branched-chain amino acid ABC transporter permease [Brucella pseudogrignonensis]KAB2683241.1 branched-chain amino acid ABC transporter permease [Brucella pseudogrignonensis]
MRNNINLVLGAPLLVIALILPLVFPDTYFLHSAAMILYFAYMATSWNFICGYVGQLSLGHAAFSGAAGYVSVLLFTGIGLSPWLGMVLGGIFAALISLPVGYVTFRLKGPYFTLTTIAFAEIMRIWLENTDEFLGISLKGAQGLTVPPVGGSSFWAFQFDGKAPYYYIILGMLVLAMLATAWMERSRLGFYLKAIRGDRDGAESLGINPTRFSLIALAISAFMTGLGGAFYAQFFRYINPERNMGIDLSIDMAIMSIVGGQGTILGPTLGALLLHPVAEYMRASFGGQILGLHLVIYGIVLMLAVLYFPKGIIAPLGRLLERRKKNEVRS